MEDQKSIEFLISTGWVVMTILAMGVILFFNIHRKRMIEKEAEIKEIEYKKQMEVLKAAITAEERQKEKIAKNLHDGVIAKLSAISRSLDKNLKDLSKNKFDSVRLEKDIIALDESITDVRGISHDLIPMVLIRLGLIKALKDFMDQIHETEYSFANFVDKTDFKTIPFSQIDQLSIYIICLEQINNLIKYSNYELLTVTVENKNDKLLLEFQHDGKGLTNEEALAYSQSAKGLGLSSISSRIILLNATIDRSKEDNWYYIHIEIPYSK